MGADNWGPKFDRNTARLERRFELCGFYDENSEHGGPRERRDADNFCVNGEDENGFCRYDKENPIRGIQQITKGFSKWAQRYVAECKLQPAKQVDHGQMVWPTFGKTRRGKSRPRRGRVQR